VSLGFTWWHLVSPGLPWIHLVLQSLTCTHLDSLGSFGFADACLQTWAVHTCAYVAFFSVHTSQRSSLDDSQQSGRALCVGTQWVTVVRSGGRCLDMPDGVMTYNCFCVRLHCCSPVLQNRLLCVGKKWTTVVRSGGTCLDMPDGVRIYNCSCVRLPCCSPLSCLTACCVLGSSGRQWYEAKADVSTCQMAS